MDAYRWQSKVYDTVLEPLNAPVRAKALRLWPPQPGSVVLDAACGTGAALADYRDAGCQVLGADPSPAMLAQARQRLGPDADLRRTIGERLPVDTAAADLVLLALVLHSIPREEALQLLAESQRALRPGGRILVTDFGVGPLKPPRGHASRGLTAVAELLAGPRHASNCVRYLRAGGLPALAAESGLRDVASHPTAGGNLTLTMLAAAGRDASA